MRVTYNRRALAQLGEIFAYVAADDPLVAAAIVDRIERLVALLSKHPAIGRPTSQENVRVLSVPRYPYVIFYRALLRRMRFAFFACGTRPAVH